MAASDPSPTFSLGRTLKISTFHIGSALSDLLTSAVWNRIMIADLGMSGGVVGFLLALRYFLAPLSLWVGYRSDTRPLFGRYRISYIWAGRGLMLLALPLLPAATVRLAADPQAPVGWGLALLSALLYGMGTQLSGAPFLALAHDSAPYARRGQVVSIVFFMLAASSAFVPIAYARLLPHYDPESFSRLVLGGMAGAAFFWVLSVVGEERRRDGVALAAAEPQPQAPFRTMLRDLLAAPQARRYGLFLGAAACFGFMYDGILEPFGAEVFGLSAGATTRFNAYWGTGVLVSMVATVWATRRWRPEQQVRTTVWGLWLSAITLGLLGIASWLGMASLVVPVLVAFGVGFGIYSVGGTSLLMAMSTEAQAGTYLALWSMIQLVLRGTGIWMGGLVRDLGMGLTGSPALAYGLAFGLEALGLLLCVVLLRRVNVSSFASHRLHSPAEVLAAAD